jgi:hypothetical protein
LFLGRGKNETRAAISEEGFVCQRHFLYLLKCPQSCKNTSPSGDSNHATTEAPRRVQKRYLPVERLEITPYTLEITREDMRYDHIMMGIHHHIPWKAPRIRPISLSLSLPLSLSLSLSLSNSSAACNPRDRERERERPTIIYRGDYTFSRQLFGTMQTSCPDTRGAVPRISAFMPSVCRTVVPNLPTIFSSESPSLTLTSCPTFSSNPSYTCPALPYPSAQGRGGRVSAPWPQNHKKPNSSRAATGNVNDSCFVSRDL